jgi:hypothetical protein
VQLRYSKYGPKYKNIPRLVLADIMVNLTLNPMRKMFQNASSLKPLGQLKPNCPGMIIERSSTKFLFAMPIGNPRWLPPQVIVLRQNHMGKIQKYILL